MNNLLHAIVSWWVKLEHKLTSIEYVSDSDIVGKNLKGESFVMAPPKFTLTHPQYDKMDIVQKVVKDDYGIWRRVDDAKAIEAWSPAETAHP